MEKYLRNGKICKILVLGASRNALRRQKCENPVKKSEEIHGFQSVENFVHNLGKIYKKIRRNYPLQKLENGRQGKKILLSVSLSDMVA